MTSFDPKIDHQEEIHTTEVREDDDTNLDCASSSKKRKGGRYGGSGKSPVWEYFTYIESVNKSECQICKFKATGKHPGNLKKHLASKFDVDHKKALEKIDLLTDDQRPATSTISKKLIDQSEQLTLPLLFSKKKPYEKDSKRYSDLVNALAILFASNSLAYRLVESPEFRHFVKLLDPKFEPPNRRRLTAIISEMFETLKEKIVAEVKDVKVNVILDIWSKKGLSESYLGVLLQYYSKKSSTIKKILIGLKKMQSSHTGENINAVVQDLLAEWNISEENILFFVTDNGSNVIKALEEYVTEFKAIQSGVDDNKDLVDFQDEAEIDPNLERSFTDSVNADVEEFENFENDHNETFSYSKRISCVAHQMACIIRKCIDGSLALRPTLVAAVHVINKFNQSGQLKELLLAYNNGRVLLSPSKTRWIFTYHMLARLLESKEAVEKIIIEKNLMDISLSAVHWNNIAQITEILEPFANAVKKLEGDTYCTLSKVIPIVVDLIERLRMGGSIGSVKKALKEEMEKRFTPLLDFSRPDFSPAHILATFFDPQFVIGLSLEQRQKCIEIVSSDLTSDGAVSAMPTFLDASAKVQKLSQQDMYSGFFKKAQPVQISSNSTFSDRVKIIKVKLEAYTEEAIGRDENESSVDAVSFWSGKRDTYGEIAVYALNILSVPASSAGIERVFSLASIVQGGKRYRLSADNTERELMIKVNRLLLLQE